MPRQRPSTDADLIERLRRLCLGFPQAVEKRSHGEPTWFAGKGKVFAMLDNHHHGAEHLSVHIPQPPGVQEALIERDPRRYFRPPYVGGAGWIGVVLDTRPRWREVEALLLEGYLHVASATLKAELRARQPKATAPAPAPRAARPRRASSGSTGSRPR